MARIIVFVFCFSFASVQLQKLIDNEGYQRGETYLDHRLNLLRDVVHENILKTESLHKTVNKLSEAIQEIRDKFENGSKNKVTGHPQTTPHLASNAVDCQELRSQGYNKSGVYQIKPDGENTSVYCDMETTGGGWTVITKRLDNTLNFNRSWSDYSFGFGSANGNYWIGNRIIHTLTTGRRRKVYFSLQFRDGTWKYAEYNNFFVAPETEKFRISYDGQSYIGNAGNGLYGHEGKQFYSEGMFFSTYDKDNDRYIGNCAQIMGGGWWYNACHQICLNCKIGVGGYVWREKKGGMEDYLIASIMMIK